MNDEARKEEEQNQEQAKEQEIDLMAEVDRIFSSDSEDPFQKEEGETEKEEEEVSGDEERREEGEEEEDSEEVSEEEDESKEEGEIEKLKAELEELKNQLAQANKAQPSGDEEQEETNEEVRRGLQLSDEQFEKVFESKEELEKLLNSHIEVTRAEILKALPPVITNLVEATRNTSDAIKDFREKNQDIFTHGVETDKDKMIRQQLIRTVVNEVQKENPNKSDAEILEESASYIRKSLGLAGVQTKEEGKKKKEDKRKAAKDAGFVKNVGTSEKKSSKEDLTDLQKEMAEMLKA